MQLVNEEVYHLQLEQLMRVCYFKLDSGLALERETERALEI
jgi:hypothetical protein